MPEYSINDQTEHIIGEVCYCTVPGYVVSRSIQAASSDGTPPLVMYGGLTCEEQKHRVPLGVNGLITQEKGEICETGNLRKMRLSQAITKKPNRSAPSQH